MTDIGTRGNANSAIGQGIGKSLPQRLVELADREGMTVTYIASKPEILQTIGLVPEQVTAGVLCKAERISQRSLRQLRARYSSPSQATELDLHREEIFGFDIRAVARWMGTDGWTFEEAWRVLDHFWCDLADETIQLYLRDGRERSGRSPAPLSSGQQETLRDLAETFSESAVRRPIQVPIVEC